VNWAEIIEEKNKRIEELEAQLENRQPIDNVALTLAKVDLVDAKKLIKWTFEKLKPPIELTTDNKLPAVREVRERLGKYLEKK
jgi:hypothetical protein